MTSINIECECGRVWHHNCLRTWPEQPPAPASLRDQYAAAISRVLLDSAGRLVPKHIAETAQAVSDAADAVLVVRDREMQQLRAELETAQRSAEQWEDEAHLRETDRATTEQRADRAEAERREAAQLSHQYRNRAERAETLLRQYVQLANVTHRYPIQGGHDCLGANLTCAGCALRDDARAALDEPTQPKEH